MISSDSDLAIAAAIAAVALVVILAIVVSLARGGEYFSTPHEKAESLMAWKKRTPSRDRTYSRFIRDNPDSNIVEYHQITGAKSVRAAEAALSL